MADEVERPKCGSCRYWEALEGAQIGTCLRHPSTQTLNKAGWRMRKTEWCGEHSDLEDGRIIYLADMLAERLGISIENALHSGILHMRNTQ